MRRADFHRNDGESVNEYVDRIMVDDVLYLIETHNACPVVGTITMTTVELHNLLKDAVNGAIL